jgi:hypothetical protein
MVVNFKARGMSRGAHKLTLTPTLIKKKTDVKEEEEPFGV